MLKIVLSLLLVISSGSLYAELLVIVHPNSEVNSLSQQQVSDLYLGRLLGQTTKLSPIESRADDLRQRFYFVLTGKQLAKIDAYWARLQFAGQQKPPRRLSDQQAVIQSISQNQDQIGFIEANQLPAERKVKVVLKLE